MQIVFLTILPVATLLVILRILAIIRLLRTMRKGVEPQPEPTRSGVTITLNEQRLVAGGSPPPSSVCPVCGSIHINLSEGTGLCHDCGAGFDMSVSIEVSDFSSLVASDGSDIFEDDEEQVDAVQISQLVLIQRKKVLILEEDV